MFKKIVLVSALIVLTAALVFGAVNRTLARTGDESTATGGNRNGSSEAVAEHTSGTAPRGNGANGQGRGAGSGQAAGGAAVDGAASGTMAGGQGAGGRGAGAQGGGQGQYAASGGDLSEAEAAALTFMREEEKLAHDVYVALYEKWGLATFQNISQSEQTHTDAIKNLLDRYGLPDPAASTAGVFTNPELQTLYTDLVARGSQSLAEALKVGAAIEEIDILDLEERLAPTDNAAIQRVFTNLLRGSQNHLRGFVSELQLQTGETYVPQYLSAEAYQAILAGSTGAGSGGASYDGHGQSQGQTQGQGQGRGRGAAGGRP